MTDKGSTHISRRSLLRTGSFALPLGLAGCTGRDSVPANERRRADDDPGESHEWPGTGITLKSVTAEQRNDNTLYYGYQDIPRRTNTGGDNFNRKNKQHPDSRNIELTIEDGLVTATLKNISVLREMNLSLWMQRNGNWEMVEDTTLERTENPHEIEEIEYENFTYQDETFEFTNLPEINTHTANTVSLVVTDDEQTAEWNTIPGRILKTAPYFAVPYDGPNGRTTRFFSGEEVTYESYQGRLEPAIITNNTYVEDLENGDKAIFVLMNTPQGDYGVATTVPQETFEAQNYMPVAGTNIIDEITDIEDSEHFNTLGNEIKTANEKLGNWSTLEDKLLALANLTADLTYDTRGPQEIRHPTGALGQMDSGRNCTEKSFIFSALLQSDPFNYSGDDAAYVGCKFLGGGHFIMGVNANKFEEIPSNWERYNYVSETIQDGAPSNAEFIMMDVTVGRVGQLAPDQYSAIQVVENLDAQYIFN